MKGLVFTVVFCLFSLLVEVTDSYSLTYSVTDLGTLGGNYSAGRAINNSGVVVGDSNAHAFYYDGNIHDMGTLGGVRSYASGINDLGIIIGSSTAYNSDYDHAYFYDGTMHDLGTLNRQISIAFGINNSNKVVGALFEVNLRIFGAFYYDGTSMIDIGTLGGIKHMLMI